MRLVSFGAGGEKNGAYSIPEMPLFGAACGS